MKTNLIVAVDKNCNISKDGKIPWYVPDEIRLFKTVTWGKTVIMGRKTFETLSGPLKGRRNIVLTSRKDYAGVETANSLELAINMAQSEIFIIGGAEVYNAALKRNYVDRIYLSVIEESYEGDKQFYVPDEFKRTTVSRFSKFTNYIYEKH